MLGYQVLHQVIINNIISGFGSLMFLKVTHLMRWSAAERERERLAHLAKTLLPTVMPFSWCFFFFFVSCGR